jgi:hypothetical protein
VSTVARPEASADQTDVPFVVRSAAKLTLLEAAFVVAISFVARFLGGLPGTLLLAVLVAAGLVVVSFLPGSWTRARSIEGIAGAAGIGLAASWMFVLVDVFLQMAGVYTHRWRDIGGGSNWWYLPVWWMVGTCLPWFGAWTLANQAARGRGEKGGARAPSVPLAALLAFVCTAVVGVIGIAIHVPGAGWNVPTFGIAFLPGLAVATLVSGLGSRRQ